MANETVNPETETTEAPAPAEELDEAPAPAEQLDDSAFWTTGPEGELVVIPDAGHMSFVEQQEPYVDAVRRFLSGIAVQA